VDNKNVIVSSIPHIHSKVNIEKVMCTVLISLAPAALLGAFYSGPRSFIVIAISVASCMLFEAAYQKLTKQKISISDLSAAVTGLLLAMNLPPSSPYWMPVVGAFVAIIIAKQLFGGLGQNFMNPALAGRAFLVAAYTPQMTASFTEPVSGFGFVDAVVTATPLNLLKSGGLVPSGADYINAFVGNIAGCIGEVSAAALVAGGLFLIITRVVTWHVPVTFIGTVFIFTFIFQPEGFFVGYPAKKPSGWKINVNMKTVPMNVTGTCHVTTLVMIKIKPPATRAAALTSPMQPAMFPTNALR